MTTTRPNPSPLGHSGTPTGSAASVSPEQQLAAQANRLGMNISVTGRDGEPVTITGRDLLTMMAREDGSQRLNSDYGIDPQDFFRGVRSAIENNQVNVDLTRRSETQALYNQNDSDYVSAERPTATDAQARVQTGLEEGFRVSGQAVDAPEMSFWDRLLDVLTEIFTFGIADTRSFNGAINEDRWRNNGATIAMAGGSALRREVNALSREELTQRLQAMVEQSNPDISSTEALTISQTLGAELREIYDNPKISGTPPDETAANARLDALHRSFVAGGAQGFGGNAGEWLQANLRRSSGELLGDLSNAASAAETEALLTLGLADFADLDAPSQSHLARLTFESRDAEGSGAALQNLVRNEAFRGLPASARRKLLSAIEQSGVQAQAIDGTARVAENLAGLSGEVQLRAAEALEGSAAVPEDYQALQGFVGSGVFRGLPQESQMHVLNSIQSAGFGAETTDALSSLLSRVVNDGPEVDSSTRRALIDGIAAARTEQERESFVTLVSAQGFANASPGVRRASVQTLQAASSQARRDNVISLLSSAGFGVLSEQSQNTILERFRGGSPAIQDAFPHVVTSLNAITAGTPPALAVDSAVAERVVTLLSQSGGTNMEAKAAGLAAILPHLQSSPHEPEAQIEFLSALQQREFGADAAQTLGELANDRSFSRVNSRVRGTILENIGSARNQTAEAMWAGLARDNDLARLSPANQRRMVEIGNRRGSAFLREARYLIGAGEFRSPGNGTLSRAQRHQHQEALLSLIGRSSPEVSLEELTGIRETMRHPDFATLSAAHQIDVVGHISNAPQDVALVTSVLANYASVPASERQRFLDVALSIPNAAGASHFNAITGASAFSSVSGSLRRTILDAIANEGAEFSSRLAPQMGALDSSSAVEQEILVSTALLQARGVSDATLRLALNRILGASDFQGLPEESRRDLLERLTTDPVLASSYAHLITNSDFASLSASSQEAIVAQSLHYPNAIAIANLTRLSGASWLSGMSLADQQRSAKLIGYVSTHRHNVTNRQQQRILDNTVAQFLPPTGTFRLNFKTYSNAPGSITYGSARGGVFNLNQALVPAGNGPVPNNGRSRHLARHTMAHEVNHLMNVDRVRDTHDYFMGEYGAWYVGFVAEHGRPPNRQESYDRARYLLTRTTGAYDSIRQARVDTEREYWIFGDNVPADEAERIIGFMGQFFNPRPSTSDPNSANVIVQSGHTPPNPTGAGPAPDVPRNMTNGGTPPAGGGGHDHHSHDH